MSIDSPRRFPHFVTHTTTVGFGVLRNAFYIAKMTAVEVKVHGIRIGTVGALYELSHNIDLDVILFITFYESVHVNVKLE